MNGFRLDNTGVIIDSDRTMTNGSYTNPQGGERIDYTSYAFLKDNKNIDPIFFKKTNALYQKYCIGIELDPNITSGVKSEAMFEWVEKVYELYYEYLSQDLLEESLADFAPKLEMRKGMPEFLEFLNSVEIPVMIYSAGVSNVITKVLEYNGFGDSNIQVLGNTLRFDDNGKFITPTREQIIQPENKTWEKVSAKIQSHFNNRTNQIVLGDSLGDIHMGDPSKNTHSIGFLLQTNKDPNGFRNTFDQVIPSEECDLGELKKKQDQLLVNSRK